MFSDFDESHELTEGKGRLGVSFALSGLIFVGTAGSIGAAVATAHAVVRERPDMMVEFGMLDEPPPAPIQEPPPPPPVEAEPPRRRRRAAISDRPPTEIPDERPAEAEGELVDVADEGPFDGFEDGDIDGTLTPEPEPTPEAEPEPEIPAPSPSQVRETITPPTMVSGCRTPDLPDALRGQAATIRIDVRMLIGADGRVLRARLLTEHPLIDESLILRCVNAQVFEPAKLPDGTAVPYPFRRRFVFRPSNP